MIDTLRVAIPLSCAQLTKLHKLLAASDDRWQWVQFHPKSGDFRFIRLKGLASLDLHSFHRNLYWDIPQDYIPEKSFLTVELSLPKFWYGHNIYLLYDFMGALAELKKLLEVQLHCRFVDLVDWRVHRLDLCYAWNLPSQRIAQSMLNSLKRLHYPRKMPIIYPSSVVFAGRTYTLKFYLKLPEFQAHDRKELLKVKASMDWIEHLERLATGVLRCEATLRKQALVQRDIFTIRDLLRPIPGDSQNLIDVQVDSDVLYPSLLQDRDYNFTNILRYFLTKFLGKHKGMEEADQVREKLLQKYKPVKAARLVSMWMYCQRFGSDDAKQAFGRDSYYRFKREVQVAGVSLTDPPELTPAEREALRNFRFEIPSLYVVNAVDDFRDSTNLLNLPPGQ